MKAHRYSIIILISIAVFSYLFWMGPIPQDPVYHDFADKRKFFGIPNFWDVASNVPMFFIGLAGISFSLKTYNDRDGQIAKWIPILLSIGIFTACFGSAYYHWAPDNHTLVWDRLPMTFMFIPLFTLLIYDFVGRKTGEWIFLHIHTIRNL